MAKGHPKQQGLPTQESKLAKATLVCKSAVGLRWGTVAQCYLQNQSTEGAGKALESANYTRRHFQAK